MFRTIQKVALSFALTLALLPAQDNRGVIQGTLRDPSGAVVPGAEVKVTNLGTNVTNSTRSNEQGYYEVPFLIPGSYKVAVTAGGFKSVVRDGITVAMKTQAVVDIPLEVGGTTESVTVTGQPPLLETATASAGLVMDSRRIYELPIVSNNVFMAPTLAPGVTNDQGTYGASLTARNSYGPRVGGGGFSTSEYSIDGSSTTLAGNRPSFVPPIYAVQEFKIETTPFDASQGGGVGGFFSAETKSGTNEYHGNLYWNHRQNRLNAAAWATNRQFYADVAAGRKKPTDAKVLPGRSNDYGFTLGGPLQLPTLKDGKPSLWSGRNKLFFFFNYHGNKSGGPGAKYYRMPTDLEKQGNFTELLARGGSQFQLYDPASARLESGKVVRDPIAGNIIPQPRISPISKNYFKFWPSPNNMAGANFDLTNNHYSFNEPRSNGIDSLLNRFDYNINDKHKSFVRWYSNRYDDLSGDFTGVGDYVFTSYYSNNGILVDHVWAHNSTTVFDFKLGWADNDSGGYSPGFGTDPTTLGWQSYLRDRAGDQMHAIPLILSNTQMLEFGTHTREKYESYNAAATGTKIAGRHTLRFGFEYRRYLYHDQKPASAAGSFNYGNNWVKKDSSASAPGSGLDFASFLFGLPNGGTINKNAFFTTEDHLWSGYFQDDWRVTSRLTLNLGIRYELPTPMTEWHNRVVREYDYTAILPITASATAAYARNPIPEVAPSQFNAKGGAQFVGINGVPRTIWNYDKNNVVPRIGAAYKLTDKLVLRGGYAVYTEPNNGSQALRAGSTYGYSQSTPYVATNDNGLTFAATMADPFPATLPGGARFLEPMGNALGSMQNAGSSYYYYYPDRKNNYSHRFRAGVQYEIAKNIMAEVAYVGSRMRDLNLDQNGNPMPEKYWSHSPVRDDSVQTYMAQQVANPFVGLLPGTGINGATVARSQLVKPVPVLTGITIAQVPVGTSKYDSVEAQVQQRFAHGLTMQLSYTGAKQFSDRYYYEFQTTPSRYLDNFFQRVAVNGLWDVPFGHGRHYGSSANPIVDALIGGWTFGGVYQYQIRGPLTFTSNYLFNGDFSKIYIPHDETTPERKFNIDAGFNRVSAQQMASYQFRVNPIVPDPRMRQMDPINQMDFSLVKNFRITERYYFRAKIDCFNITNHPMFNAPDTSPTSGTFGQVAGYGTYAPMRNYLFTAQFFF